MSLGRLEPTTMLSRQGVVCRVTCFALFLVCLRVGAGGLTEQQTPREGELARMREEMRSRDVPIYFCARVIDQHGVPVQGAKAVVHIRHFTPVASPFMATKHLTLTTDAEGVFEVKGYSGQSLFVKSIQKSGYEFSYKANRARGFRYWREGGQKAPPVTVEAPAVFRMRKKGVATFLLTAEGARQLARPSQAAGCDLVCGRSVIIGSSPGHVLEKMHLDLRVESTYSEDKGKYTVCFAVPDKEGGIAVADGDVYEAPGDGYKAAHTVEVRVAGAARPTHGDEGVWHLFIRSRSPAIYSRVRVALSAGERLRIRFQSWTNPYGERDLEQASDIPGKQWLQLYKEAQEALLRGELPRKPDLGGRPRLESR